MKNNDIEIQLLQHSVSSKKIRRKTRKLLRKKYWEIRKKEIEENYYIYETLNVFPKNAPFMYIFSFCVECGAPLVVTSYIGSDLVLEIVCPNCGLVHAVFGSNFYLKETEEIKTQLRGK